MLQLLNEVAPFLRTVLEKELSNISSDWWNCRVVSNLTEQQQRNVRQKKVTSLDGLDLAALLRIFDSNYFDIQNSLELPRETRSWLKELQQVRNRWAHQVGGEARADDLFRDLDTVERFLGAIGGDLTIISEIQVQKSHVLQIIAKPLTSSSQPSLDISATEFRQSEIVRLKSSLENAGPVIRVIAGSPQNRFEVFIDGI